jgi:penicillin G amidase
MDLFRRRSSGRLSELFGAKSLAFDEFHRKFGFSRGTKYAAERMPDAQRGWLEAYAEGVNAFIQQGPMPFEMRAPEYRSPEEILT